MLALGASIKQNPRCHIDWCKYVLTIFFRRYLWSILINFTGDIQFFFLDSSPDAQIQWTLDKWQNFVWAVTEMLQAVCWWNNWWLHFSIFKQNWTDLSYLAARYWKFVFGHSEIYQLLMEMLSSKCLCRGFTEQRLVVCERPLRTSSCC